MKYSFKEQEKHRKALVSALRGNTYNQITQFLHDDTGFDIFGVACDVSGIAEWYPAGHHRKENVKDKNVPLVRYYRYGNHASVMILPDKVRQYYGFTEYDGDFLAERNKNGNWWKNLMDMNDKGTTFAEFADIIEKEPEWLFSDWGKKNALPRG